MKTIMVVEDDPHFREMLKVVLELRGFKVLTAESTGEALEIAACHALDAVVSDFQVPKSNGLQFCREFQKQNAALGRSIPVWLMTGGVSLTTMEALQAGATGVFRKPFKPVNISKTIERQLGTDLVETELKEG